MVTYLPSDVPPYSCKQIKRKLIEHYGSQINISALNGVQNVISFKDTAANILYDTYREIIDVEDQSINDVKDI